MRFFRILGGREDLLGKKELFLFEPLGEVRCFGGGTFFLLPFSSSFVVDVLFSFFEAESPHRALVVLELN